MACSGGTSPKSGRCYVSICEQITQQDRGGAPVGLAVVGVRQEHFYCAHRHFTRQGYSLRPGCRCPSSHRAKRAPVAGQASAGHYHHHHHHRRHHPVGGAGLSLLLLLLLLYTRAARGGWGSCSGGSIVRAALPLSLSPLQQLPSAVAAAGHRLPCHLQAATEAVRTASQVGSSSGPQRPASDRQRRPGSGTAGHRRETLT